MNITFLIGNGFDVNLGLKTQYRDFYEYYKKHDPKDIISKSINNESNYELWSDLELGLGLFLKNIHKDQIDEYLNSKDKLEEMLTEYLLIENKRLILNADISTEFKNKIINFYKDFSVEDKEECQKILAYCDEKINYKFVTYNYTDALDRIIAKTVKDINPFYTHKYAGTIFHDTLSEPLHIHGSLGQDMILGINDTSQINNSLLKNNTDIKDCIVKPTVNKNLRNKRIASMEKIINDSSYICLYGLSMGDTDNIWWSYLIKWLLRSQKNRLVLFVYDSTKIQCSAQQKIRFINKNKNIMFQKGKCDEKTKKEIENRIIVVHNSDIFNFEKIV